MGFYVTEPVGEDMATAKRPRDGDRDRSGMGDLGGEALATKVVLMELVDASGALSVDDLTDRTTLSERTVRSALLALGSTGVCERTEPPGDRAPRFRLGTTAVDEPARV